jgi:hypothetical protein
MENPGYGGWGGRFVPEKPGVTNGWKDIDDGGDANKPIWRWAQAFQNDWAARADWSVKSYSEANHAPVVNLAVPADIQAATGSTVKLSADPDGDRLNIKWWQYRDAGTYKGDVTVRDADKEIAYLQIPPDARPGDTIHLIAEVTDSGKPPLTRYARIIVTVGAK